MLSAGRKIEVVRIVEVPLCGFSCGSTQFRQVAHCRFNDSFKLITCSEFCHWHSPLGGSPSDTHYGPIFGVCVAYAVDRKAENFAGSAWCIHGQCDESSCYSVRHAFAFMVDVSQGKNRFKGRKP